MAKGASKELLLRDSCTTHHTTAGAQSPFESALSILGFDAWGQVSMGSSIAKAATPKKEEEERLRKCKRSSQTTDQETSAAVPSSTDKEQHKAVPDVYWDAYCKWATRNNISHKQDATIVYQIHANASSWDQERRPDRMSTKPRLQSLQESR